MYEKFNEESLNRPVAAKHAFAFEAPAAQQLGAFTPATSGGRVHPSNYQG
jgi:hypothetical protein